MESPTFTSSAASSRSSSPSPSALYPNSTIYFAYGTDLWHQQLLTRCPSAKFLGIGRLRHWRFQINSLGYANVVESPMPSEYDAATLRWLGPLLGSQGGDPRTDNERAYGAVWAISESDEKKLDVLERVGQCYTKEEASIEFWSSQSHDGQTTPVSVLKRAKRSRAVFHVDRINTQDAELGKGCSMQYAYRMNQGIIDALANGVPQGYVDKCIRSYLPQSDDAAMDDTEEMIKKGMMDAVRLGIDVRKLVEQVESELAMNGPIIDEKDQSGEENVLKKLLREMTPQQGTASQLDTARRRALTSGF
jgi:gamma-glutamylcyclotransferase